MRCGWRPTRGRRARASDSWIARLAPQWPPKRQPGVDRSILRLAVHELTSGQTPPKVVIDEAIELAKSFPPSKVPASSTRCSTRC